MAMMLLLGDFGLRRAEVRLQAYGQVQRYVPPFQPPLLLAEPLCWESIPVLTKFFAVSLQNILRLLLPPV